jgi:hypothetical protein
MNYTLPSRDCGRRSADPFRPYRFAGAVLGTGGLVGGAPVIARFGHEWRDVGARSFTWGGIGLCANVATGQFPRAVTSGVRS